MQQEDNGENYRATSFWISKSWRSKCWLQIKSVLIGKKGKGAGKFWENEQKGEK